MSIKVRLYEGELLEQGLHRFKRVVNKARKVPPHKKMMKALLTRGQKRRQKELTAALHKRWYDARGNPNYGRSA